MNKEASLELKKFILSDKKNSYIFNKKMLEIEEYIDEKKRAIHEVNEEMFADRPEDKWFREVTLGILEKQLAKLEASYRRFKYYKDKCLGRENKNEIDIAVIKQGVRVEFLLGITEKSCKLQMIKCPIHNEKTASFAVYKNNSWYCFGEHIGGDVIDLYQMMNKCSFVEAITELNKMV